MTLSRDHARVALAAIRLVNGGLALLAPQIMLRRFEAGQAAHPGTGPDPGRVVVYPLRMFGIRTVVLGIQLLASGPGRPTGSLPPSGPVRPSGSLRQQGRVGVVIHAADAASAITAGLRRQLPARVAVVAAAISAANTALAWILATDDDGADAARGHGADIARDGRRTDSEHRTGGAAGPPATHPARR